MILCKPETELIHSEILRILFFVFYLEGLIHSFQPAGVIWAGMWAGLSVFLSSCSNRREAPCFFFEAKTYLKGLSPVNLCRLVPIWKDTAQDISCAHCLTFHSYALCAVALSSDCSATGMSKICDQDIYFYSSALSLSMLQSYYSLCDLCLILYMCWLACVRVCVCVRMCLWQRKGVDGCVLTLTWLTWQQRQLD